MKTEVVANKKMIRTNRFMVCLFLWDIKLGNKIEMDYLNLYFKFSKLPIRHAELVSP